MDLAKDFWVVIRVPEHAGLPNARRAVNGYGTVRRMEWTEWK